MIPDNFNQLSLKAQFRVMYLHFAEILGLQPRDIYHDTKHHYNFIREMMNNDVDHKIDTADNLAEKMGYKLIFLWVPKSKMKNQEEYEKILQLLKDISNHESGKI